nr:hypothetical protein [uncultured Pseudomonas sp.]
MTRAIDPAFWLAVHGKNSPKSSSHLLEPADRQETPETTGNVINHLVCLNTPNGVYLYLGVMAHFVTGIIARPAVLASFASEKSLHPPVALPAGLALLALRDRYLDSFLPLPLTGGAEGFTYLSDQLLTVLFQLSSQGAVMYFETEYFGGVGTQGAIAMVDSRTIYGPQASESGSINRALAMLGVQVQPPACDEFDTLGLGRHRSAEDWFDVEYDDDA